MSTVLRSARPVNSAASASASPLATLSAVAWHALQKTADKEAARDDLPPGSAHLVNFAILGDIDGERFEQSISATLTVGHDSTRATSSTPSADRVVASILAKLNERTREAILRDLPEDFAANGCSLPDVSPELAEKAAGMLVRLRAKKTVDVRGSISCKYRLGELRDFADGGQGSQCSGADDEDDSADRDDAAGGAAEVGFAIVG
jgi:hypothetical protein